MKPAIRMITILLAFGLGACDSEVDEGIETMKKFKDEMCACKDKACAEKSTTELVQWAQEAAERYSGEGGLVLTEAQAKEAVAVTKELTKCM